MASPRTKRRLIISGPTGKIAQRQSKNTRVKIHLDYKHCINGKDYGPGDVLVPHAMVEGFMAQETRVRREEQKFLARRAFIVGARGRKMEVPYDSFDSTHMAMVLSPNLLKEGL